MYYLNPQAVGHNIPVWEQRLRKGFENAIVCGIIIQNIYQYADI
jgi:hypothetical protein